MMLRGGNHRLDAPRAIGDTRGRAPRRWKGEMQAYRGGCHCGNISYTLDWPLDELVLARCDCSFCAKQGVVYTGHRRAVLSITVKDAAAVARYAFDSHTAQCHFCSRCGVYTCAISTIDGRDYAVINANTLHGFTAPETVRMLSFAGETTPDRLARRARTWIAQVSIAAAIS
jgi:hypothetical protein